MSFRHKRQETSFLDGGGGGRRLDASRHFEHAKEESQSLVEVFTAGVDQGTVVEVRRYTGSVQAFLDGVDGSMRRQKERWKRKKAKSGHLFY